MLEALPENPSLGSNKAGEIIVNGISTKWAFLSRLCTGTKVKGQCWKEKSF